MKTHKLIDKIGALVTVLAILLTLAFMNGEALGLQKIVDEDAQQNSDLVSFTANDLNGDWESSDMTMINLQGDTAQILGNGAYETGGSVTIKNGGYYRISGELSDGSLIVDAYRSSKVWILLDGVTISSSENACIRVDEADKVFLTLAEGSENILSGPEAYSQEALEDGTDGVVFAHDDLTINGAGTLTVTALTGHGIAANDDLVITGGTITVKAPKDGIHVNDSIRICSAAIHISAGDDGIHSDTSFLLADGSITIDSCYEGIEALTIEIQGGEVTIHAADDGLNANGGSDDAFGFGGGGFALSASPSEEADSDGEEDVSVDPTDETWIHISGGTLTILNETGTDADGLDSNGDIVITGGSIYISLTGDGGNCAIDYGSENGGACTINGGTVIACGGASMVEEMDESSQQSSILYLPDMAAEAQTAIALSDMEGNTLLEWIAPYAFSSILVSCPQMQQGDTYTLTLGDTAESITLTEMAQTIGAGASTFPAMPGQFQTQAAQQVGQGESQNQTIQEGWGEPQNQTIQEGRPMNQRDQFMQQDQARGQAGQFMQQGQNLPQNDAYESAKEGSSQSQEEIGISLSAQARIYLAITIAALILGLLIAFLYRK